MAALFLHTSDTYPPGEQQWTTGLRLQAQILLALIGSLQAIWTPSTHQLPEPHSPPDLHLFRWESLILFLTSLMHSPAFLWIHYLISSIISFTFTCPSPSAALITPLLFFHCCHFGGFPLTHFDFLFPRHISISSFDHLSFLYPSFAISSPMSFLFCLFNVSVKSLRTGSHWCVYRSAVLMGNV